MGNRATRVVSSIVRSMDVHLEGTVAPISNGQGPATGLFWQHLMRAAS